jgi:protein phosphatase
MPYRFCSQTHAGLVRENNEDALFMQEALGLVILADGMGGYKAGEVASGMAVQVIAQDLVDWLAQAPADVTDKSVRRAMEVSVEKANTAVYQASLSNEQFTGMGTTLVVAVFRPHTLVVGHVGDSRCYRLRRGQLTQLTKDHSLLQERLDAGLMTRKQVANSSQKNVVTRALGVEDGVVIDINDFTLTAGDSYLFCSDGLSDLVQDRQIAKILVNEPSLELKASSLVNTANAYGGHDNISVVLVETDPITKRRTLFSRLLGK